MGREIKRVPVDFDWPFDKVWEGYLRPDRLDGKPCPDCKGGQTYAGWWLQALCQRLDMLAADVRDQERGRPMHPWLANDPYPPTDSTHLFMSATRVLRPSRDWLTLIAGLTRADEDSVGNAFSSRGEYSLFQAIVKAAGLEHWGGCETCDGEGTLEVYPGQRAEAEAWEPTEPPAGEPHTRGHLHPSFQANRSTEPRVDSGPHGWGRQVLGGVGAVRTVARGRQLAGW